MSPADQSLVQGEGTHLEPLQDEADLDPDADQWPDECVAAGARRMRIGLLGTYASANLGDTAAQRAVMSALRRRRADLEFVGLCTDPEDAARTLRVSAFRSSGLGELYVPQPGGMASLLHRPRMDLESLPAPLRIGAAVARIHRQMRSLDMLIVSGSGQIEDHWGGAWAQPFRLLSWCAAARRQRKPAAVFGVGVDRLTTRLGGFFSVRAMRLPALRVLRDAGSLDALRAMGMKADTTVCPDPAFSLRPPADIARPGGAGQRPIVVISPISRLAWPGIETVHYDRYIHALAALADHLQRRSLRVRFVCSQQRMDPPLVERVRERMHTDPALTEWREARTVDDYMRAVAPARLVVASRLHALILAMVAGTPVIAISAVRKVMRQLEDVGLPDHALDVRKLHTRALIEHIDAALHDADALRAHLAATTRRMRAQLEVQFDRLAALVPEPSDPSARERAA